MNAVTTSCRGLDSGGRALGERRRSVVRLSRAVFILQNKSPGSSRFKYHSESGTTDGTCVSFSDTSAGVHSQRLTH